MWIEGRKGLYHVMLAGGLFVYTSPFRRAQEAEQDEDCQISDVTRCVFSNMLVLRRGGVAMAYGGRVSYAFPEMRMAQEKM